MMAERQILPLLYSAVRHCCWQVLLIAIVLASLVTAAHASAPRRVLLISSYHPAFPTFFDQAHGIRDIFNPLSIELDIEFLDSKRFPYEETAPRMYLLLQEKLAQLPPYLVVMAADDNALKFVLHHQNNLFRDIPMVFLGINDLQFALQQNENPLVTGVVEAVSMEDTIRLMPKLQPQVNTVVALVDSTPSGQGDLRTYYQAAKRFPELSFTHLSLAKLSWDEFKDRLKNVNANETLLLLSAFRDKNAAVLSFSESLDLIIHNAPVPVYHLWYHGLGDGILGGKVISQYEQGKTAAQIAVKIIKGTPASQIPVNKESPNRYFFDYTQLKKYAIDPALLPKDSTLLHRPYSFFREHRELSILIVSAFLVILLALLLSFYALLLKRKTELQLKASESKYRTLIEGTNDAIVSVDHDRLIRSWNTGAAAMFGYREEEIIGSHVSRLIPEDLLQENREFINEFFAENDHFGLETEIQTKAGKRIAVDINFNRQADHTGKPAGISGFIRDITDRRKAESALQESEEKFSSAFHNAPVLMAISTIEDNTLLEVNEAFLTATGYDYGSVVGKTMSQIGLIPEDQFAALQKELRQNGRVHNHEITFVKADKTNLDCLYFGEILTMGNSSKILTIATDLTERKKLEQDLLQAQKMEAIGTLAGGIAHDFNNILAAIIGYTEISIQDCPPDLDIREDLQEVLEAGNRAKGLVQQILDFSRQGKAEQRLIQPARLIKENLKMLRPSLPSTIDIVQHIQSTGTILIDPTHINQIVFNLCTNAYHAMEKSGGTLGVTLDSQEIDARNCIHLAISDTGSGIEPSIQERIFEPYFTTKEHGKGTGMGLSIVHGLVTAYKGFITIESEPGKGTCVHVYLPVIGQKNSEDDRNTANSELTGSEHILLVDDEEVLVNMTSTMLTRLGYRVTSTTSSLDALELFNQMPQEFDLVITDQTMPTITGIELAKKLRRIRPDLPVILCTGFSSIVSEKEAKKVGIKEFALKPLSRKKLSALIRNALDN